MSGGPAAPLPRVLLVDDDEFSRALTLAALHERGFVVTEAASGEQALEMLPRLAPDIVVLDAVMPGLDGFATCERLRRLPAGQRLPVLMLTALDDDASIQRAFEAGATDFFVKSAQWTLLAGRLHHLLHSAQTHRELESSRAQLASARELDALTGLPNRRQFIRLAEPAVEHAHQTGRLGAVLLVDLDRFKVINDTLGHAAGDELLVEVARRLRAGLGLEAPARLAAERPSVDRNPAALMPDAARAPPWLPPGSHAVLGRLGGDEFVVLLGEVHGEHEARVFTARLQQALQAPMQVAGQECILTASVGIAVFPRDGRDLPDLLRHADVATHAVKTQGRNAALVYTPELPSAGREKLALETALHKALERGELVLHYQPKVNLDSRRLVGTEALVRWQRDGVLLPPGEFISLAEDTGLIVPISHWAIGEAARQASRWQQQRGRPLPIAVNLPARMFQRPDLLDVVHAALKAHQTDPACLQFEITETALMRELQTVIPALEQLNALGVCISIDDFGTGYSSLAYLTTLPITELKIDRSFVLELGQRPESTAVASAIIALARALKLGVVAEGVETMLQMQVLHRLGCAQMQGYLFSMPLAPDDIEPWLGDDEREAAAPWLSMFRPS